MTLLGVQLARPEGPSGSSLSLPRKVAARRGFRWALSRPWAVLERFSLEPKGNALSGREKRRERQEARGKKKQERREDGGGKREELQYSSVRSWHAEKRCRRD